jgi:hypothetical protein
MGVLLDICIALLGLVLLLIVGLGAINAALRASVTPDDPDDADQV